MREQIEAVFPNLTSLLRGTEVDSDIDWAIELRNAANGIDELKYAFKIKLFARQNLILALCSGPLLGDPCGVGLELESNLATILSVVGASQTKKAFLPKLVVGYERTFIETRYEIAVAALACRTLNPESVQLEALIKGTRNNTDVMGKFGETIVRIESTVAHDDPVPAVDVSLREIIEEASTADGFVVTLGRAVHSPREARDVRVIVELLFEHHVRSPRLATTIEDHAFSWRGGIYVCHKDAATIRTVQFELPAEVRVVEFPVQTRSVEPKYMIEDVEQPEDVTTLANVPSGSHHNPIPLSTKIHQALDVKRKQCAPGVVNIIVLGKPMPMSDKAVSDALFSVPGVSLLLIEEAGVRRFGEALMQSDGKAPFVPADRCPDPAQYIEPFRSMSGVLLLRLNGGNGISRLFVNPNADQTIPDQLRNRLASEVVDPTLPPVQPVAGVGSSVLSSPPSAEKLASGSAEEKEIRDELALNLTGCCETIDAARALLRKVGALGITIEEMQRQLKDPSKPKGPGQTRFLSPSCEEIAFELIIACEGVAAAIDFFEAWLAEPGRRD
jgi:hypothetical protein